MPYEARKSYATLPGAVDDARDLDVAPASGVLANPRTGPKHIRAGDLIGERYRVLSAAATGGMGSVYVCDDTLLGRPVVVKLAHASSNPDVHFMERFFDEARITAQLESLHVARLYDYAVGAAGEPYMISEFVDGPDLFTVLQTEGPRSCEEVVAYALQICEGLREAHRKGIVHCDLKPENLVLTRTPEGAPVVKIVDFGISRWTRDPYVVALPRRSVLSGSPYYMSPEQIETPAHVDCGTDIWSLGVVMFELVTGRVPFAASDDPQTYAAVLNGAVPSVSSLRAGVPPELDEIIRRCLKKDRSERFSDVGELSRALGEIAPRRFAKDSHESDASQVSRAGVDRTSAPVDPGRARRTSHARRRGLSALAVTVTFLLGLPSDQSQIENGHDAREMRARIP